MSIRLLVPLLLTFAICYGKKSTPPQIANPLKEEYYARRAQQKERTSHKRKLMTELSIEELEQRKNKLLATNKIMAFEHIEYMLGHSDDLDLLKQLRLERADLCFDLGHLAKAEEFYREYLTLYPGSDKTEYVNYKTLLCCFYETLEPDRDQTKTREALQTAQTYLEQPTNTQYLKEVKSIRRQCYNKLFESEVNVFEYYLNNNKFTAAEQRLAHIKDEFKTSISNIEVKTLRLECALAEKQNDIEKAQKLQEQIATHALPLINKDQQLAIGHKRRYSAMF
ncbi:outer membrane protein assembly factor BamD [Candidatus Babeliales bacterium]|nr:outer membrane protein assembly factor BamD [Candidatus Babeliales bacterium]